MESNRDRRLGIIRIAIRIADIEVLVNELRQAFDASTKEGQEVKELIEKNLDDLAEFHRLPQADSFKQLVERYDRKKYRDMLRAGEVEKVVQLVNSSNGERLASLVALAAFHSQDYLPSIKEGSAHCSRQEAVRL